MSPSTIEQMLTHRLHIGHISSQWHPKFAPFILTKKNERHIIDLRKTHHHLQQATKKLQEIAANGGEILFVGTKKQARTPIIQIAQALEAPYIVERWLGGTLTNFSTLYKSIKKMATMDEIENSIAYKNLTKKEQSIKQGKKIKLQRNLAGLQHLRRPPQALFIVDIKREATAINEAQKLNIPIFAIVDTNTNPQKVDYPIPANDDAKDSIAFILNYISEHLKPIVEQWKKAKNTPQKQTPTQGKNKTPKASTTTTPKETQQKPSNTPTNTPETKKEKPKETKSETQSTKSNKTTQTPKETDTPPMDKKEKLAALKTLRNRTKAGIMDCQEALTQAQGNIDKAIDILYQHAQKKVEKLSQQETPQNFVFGAVNQSQDTGILIQLSCQTDFVGNNQDFTKLANEIVQTALQTKATQPNQILNTKIQNKTIQQLINFWIAAFGENIILSDYIILSGEHITCFIHPNKKTGTLLDTNKTKTQSKDNPTQQIAMQIAITKPMAITTEEVINTLQAGGKTIPNVEKIAQGKALLTQPFFQDETKTVADYLKATDPELTIKAFLRAPQSKVSSKK